MQVRSNQEYKTTRYGVAVQRDLVPEWMDDPNLDPLLHDQALRGLKRINFLSFTAKQLAAEIERNALRAGLTSVRVLDIACGNGIVAREVADRLDRHGLPCTMTGWDISQTAIAGAPNSRNAWFEVRDIFAPSTEPAPDAPKEFDYCYSTLFLHHLNDEQSLLLLKRMKQLARYGALISDLKRSNWGWWMAYVVCRLLTRSPVVHYDGPQSVRAAYTMQEAVKLAQASCWSNAVIRRQWPERFLLTGSW